MVEKEAVIFDMDNLMIDSEPIQSRSFEVVLKEYGKNPFFNENGIVQTVGIGAKDNWLQMQSRYDLQEDIEILIEKKRRVYVELLRQGVAPMPGFLSLLYHLKDYQLKKAVASSSARENIDLVVAHLNIQEYFDAFISGEQVKRGKPAPDIFLEAASQLRANTSYCVVLEDADSGVQAAKDAGMKVIAVPNRFTQHHDFRKADKIVPSLEYVNWRVISSL